jgi:hypothetical protein
MAYVRRTLYYSVYQCENNSIPRHVGIRNSNFDRERYIAGYGENSRERDVTTDGILSSLDALNDAIGDGLADEVVNSPMYISPKR